MSEPQSAPDERRRAARTMAAEAVDAGRPLAWFEQLYRAAAQEEAVVPWAEMTVNPHLATWSGIDDEPSGRALVVGCGYGDDAEWLAARGWNVTAFDVSQTAVDVCRERFPDSAVEYVAADLLDPPAWQPFDLVVEIYTIQVLPPGSPERARAFDRLTALTAGRLLVVARGRAESDDVGQMPWPLTVEELRTFGSLGLTELSFEDYLDDEEPPVRRLRAVYGLTSAP